MAVGFATGGAPGDGHAEVLALFHVIRAHDACHAKELVAFGLAEVRVLKAEEGGADALLVKAT